MTCEDCYHYEACKEKFAGLRKICVKNPEKHLELDPRAEIVCQQFKDKSLIIELPCKVGDKVYAVIRSICFGNHIQEMTIKEFGIYAQTDFAVITRWPNVFLDKSKAEARLKELKKNE